MLSKKFKFCFSSDQSKSIGDLKSNSIAAATFETSNFFPLGSLFAFVYKTSVQNAFKKVLILF